VVKGSASPRLLSCFGDAELAKQNVELCPGPGAEGSRECYKTVRRALWSWVCGFRGLGGDGEHGHHDLPEQHDCLMDFSASMAFQGPGTSKISR